MSYEQEWEQYQKILKDIEQANEKLIEVEAARNAAIQSGQKDGHAQQQGDIAQLEAQVERARMDKAEAETRKGAYELQVAEKDPEKARWLEERIEPPKERTINTEAALKNLDDAKNVLTASVKSHIEPIIENIPNADFLLQKIPNADLVSKVAAHVVDNRELMVDYTMGALRTGVEKVKEIFEEKNAAKEWEIDIHKKEQAVNEKFDKEKMDTEKSHQKQVDYIEKKYDDKGEKENKQNELRETIEKVKADIEKSRNSELQKIEAEKVQLELAKEATKDMEEKKRQAEIERQHEIERQRQLEEQNRKR
jgi:hypothetical protein